MKFTHRPYDDVPPFLRSPEAAMEWLDWDWLVERTSFIEVCGNWIEFSGYETHEEVAKHPEVIRMVRDHQEDYLAFAEEVYAKGFAEVFRAISVDSHDRVSLDSLGRYWGRYGGEVCWDTPLKRFGEDRTGWHDVLIKARVEPTAVDWEEGFVAFLIYGTSEWEVRLRPGVPVKVLEVDGDRALGKKVFSPPVVGNSGPWLPPRGGLWD